jgi:hypothetical protein
MYGSSIDNPTNSSGRMNYSNKQLTVWILKSCHAFFFNSGIYFDLGTWKRISF